MKPSKQADALSERARIEGLDSIDRSQRSGHLARGIGDVAESLAEIVLDEQGYTLFWEITIPGIHGADLLFLAPDLNVLASAAQLRGAAAAGQLTIEKRHWS